MMREQESFVCLVSVWIQVGSCFKIRVNFVIGREQSSVEAQCFQVVYEWVKRWPAPGKH